MFGQYIKLEGEGGGIEEFQLEIVFLLVELCIGKVGCLRIVIYYDYVGNIVCIIGVGYLLWMLDQFGCEVMVGIDVFGGELVGNQVDCGEMCIDGYFVYFYWL